MMGINVNRTISFTFLLAGGLAGIGAVLFLVEFNIRYDTGFELGLIAFTAAVLGGIGNLYGRRPRRAHHRADPGLQRGPVPVGAGQRLDPLDRLRDPDRDPRLPARGPARRTHAGGRVVARRRDRARSAYRSYRGQAAQTSGLELGAAEWRKLPKPVRTFVARRDPADDRDPLPVLPLEPADRERPADLLVPVGALGGDDPRLHDDGGRPERRRRLLRPARPRLRRLLRDRRLHRGLARLGPVPAGATSTSARSGSAARGARDPHLDLARAADRGAC